MEHRRGVKSIHFTDSLEVLEYLLNQGADINATDRMSNTLINMVMSRDDNTWANFLIDRGADPTIVAILVGEMATMQYNRQSTKRTIYIEKF